jgi:hypothetical protein
MIQKDRVKEMEYWASVVVKKAQKDKNLKSGIVAANNHYAGFGPGTANIFRKLVGLPEAASSSHQAPISKSNRLTCGIAVLNIVQST